MLLVFAQEQIFINLAAPIYENNLDDFGYTGNLIRNPLTQNHKTRLKTPHFTESFFPGEKSNRNYSCGVLRIIVWT